MSQLHFLHSEPRLEYGSKHTLQTTLYQSRYFLSNTYLHLKIQVQTVTAESIYLFCYINKITPLKLSKIRNTQASNFPGLTYVSSWGFSILCCE